MNESFHNSNECAPWYSSLAHRSKSNRYLPSGLHFWRVFGPTELNKIYAKQEKDAYLGLFLVLRLDTEQSSKQEEANLQLCGP